MVAAARVFSQPIRPRVKVRTIILMYHGVIATGSVAANLHCISEDRFIEQMDYLKVSGHPILPWRDMSTGGLDGDGAAVGLTFDDANRSDVTCASILRSRGYSALFFVPTDYLDRSERLAKADVAELSRQGMGIGSHSHHHVQLVHLSESQLDDELRRSKGILEDIIKLPVEHLSFPGGAYNARILAAARKAGYRYFYTSEWGSNGAKETAAGVLRRIPVVDGLNGTGFRNVVEMSNYRRKRVQFHLKELAKRALGEQSYLTLRRALVKRPPAPDK